MFASRGRVHGDTPRGRAQLHASRLNEGRFGYLFPTLQPAPPYPPERLHAAAEAMRETDAPPDPGPWGTDTAQPPSGDNDDLPAAYTYFGQFIDHDVTFDPTSRLGTATDPDALTTFRSPRFDLDSLYGSGPVDEPFQYEQGPDRFGYLLTAEPNAGEHDLPRNDEDTALIGDPRNDENVIVSQLQVAFLRFHNRRLDDAIAAGVAREAAFDEARRSVRWHYQWVVVHDFLPRICGPELVGELLEKDPTSGAPDFDLAYYPRRGKAGRQGPFMPVEFSAAAFRFGHSQVRAAYALNGNVSAPLFVSGDDVAATEDLRGHKVLPPNWAIDWSFFLKLSERQSTPSRLIDGKLAAPLFDLPRLPAGDQQSLAERNLQRGQDLGLPAGQEVARHIGAEPLTGGDLGTDLDPTPLWLYTLLEASSAEGGRRLGPVGARIVAETLLGLLAHDQNSYLTQDGWTPELAGGSSPDETFGLADVLRYALQLDSA